MEKSELQESSSLREILTTLFKHKNKISAVFLTVVATVTLVTFILPPVYEAKSSLMVKIGREYMNRTDLGDSRAVMSLNQEEMANSEIEILMNHDLIKKVITTLRPDTLYPAIARNPPRDMSPLEAATKEFAKHLTVEGVKKSNVIQVSFRHKDPRIAARAVNLLVEFYTEKHLQVFSDPKSSFLEKQLAVYEQKLKESENNLQIFKQKNRVFSLDEQRSLLLKQHTELDTSYKYTQNAIYELQKKISTIQDQMKSISENKPRYTNTERDKIIVEAKAKLLTLQLNEQELLKKYTENNRLVVNVRKEIQLVNDFLKQEEEGINDKVKTGNAIYQNVEVELMKAESELNSQKAKAVSLRQQLAQVDREIQSLDLSEKDEQALKRERLINEKNYATYVDRTEEARISDDMNRLKLANISVIQNASIPAEPIRPKKALNMILGIVLGAITGLGFAFLSEITSQSFSVPESVERQLGLSVLATVPQQEG